MTRTTGKFLPRTEIGPRAPTRLQRLMIASYVAREISVLRGPYALPAKADGPSAIP
jgi:hypothetical protein